MTVTLCLLGGIALALTIRVLNPTSDAMAVLAAVLFAAVMLVVADRRLVADKPSRSAPGGPLEPPEDRVDDLPEDGRR